MYTLGDILVINFPFSDGKSSKHRPVAVIKDTNDNDILIAKITSKSCSTEFDVTINEWSEAGLLLPSVIRVHKIQTLHTSLVFGCIGRLTVPDVKLLRRTLANLILS